MANSKLYKGSLQTIILNLLEKNDRMYGYEITQKVKLITNGELKITEGALYPALHKLESEGFLESEILTIGNRMRLAELEKFIKNIFFSVLFYIAIYIIPIKVNRIMEKTYPNYQVL